MKKRTFLKVSSIIVAGSMIGPLSSCTQEDKKSTTDSKSVKSAASLLAFELPALPYAFNALEPYIDQQTMEIHHGKHHAGYVRKLNKALSEKQTTATSLESLLNNVTADETAVRNNGGGHYNHSLFWDIMAPASESKPSADLLDLINKSFGSFEQFKTEFGTAAKTRFGSGWAWLSVDQKNKLQVSSTPNQDNPLMSKIIADGGTPILGLDVWEHAYYLKYQNKRGDYVDNFFNLINWNAVAKRFTAAMM